MFSMGNASADLAIASAVPTDAELRECPSCGQFQSVPPLLPGAVARCLQCNRVLRRVRADPVATPLALSFGALVLFVIACTMTLMDVSTLGLQHQANLLTGPVGLSSNGLWELGLVVLFTSVLAPLTKLLRLLYVLTRLVLPGTPPRHLRAVFAWVERISPWSMVEVYLVGTFVAYVKLIDIVQIRIGVALWALVGTMLLMVAIDALLDPDAVWEEMHRRGIHRTSGRWYAPSTATIACTVCGLVGSARDKHCLRCDAPLHRRKPNSVNRAWALLITASVLYIPANVYPVLTIIQGGSGQPSTILGGVEELITSGMYPLAAVVFLASIAVPMLKIIGLALLLIWTQTRRLSRLRDRTRLYRIVEVIGRWSMIDIFMESILVALVQFGGLITIDPGVGAVAFCAVVILTMLAANCFDPRLMWDAAAERTREIMS